MMLGDAFRAPLYEAFKILEIVRNYQNENDSKTLGHVCLHVEAISRGGNNYKNVLPEYSCLVLSPANMWQQDVVQFSADNSLINTIFGHLVIELFFFRISLKLWQMCRFFTCHVASKSIKVVQTVPYT